MDYDEEFLSIFNEHYPFEYYIFKEPASLELTFDDVVLTEIFVPETTNIRRSEDYIDIVSYKVHVKLKGSAGEMRFAYMDFNENVREAIRDAMILDFGAWEYQSLYMELEDEEDKAIMKQALTEQMWLIKNTYGECKIKHGKYDETFGVTNKNT